ncbi:MAG: hypothetical protein II158_01035, partial [Bacilli bacterium]|nr:hypothetical protein [Bacilli bacterium]
MGHLCLCYRHFPRVHRLVSYLPLHGYQQEECRKLFRNPYFYPGAFDPAHPFANSAPAPKADKKDGDEASEHHRFPTLSAYDDAHPAFEQIERDPSLTLESLCDDFRDFCASERGLYYSKRDIRTFISALSASHPMILQGMSGTGKTSLPVAFGVYIGSSTDVVP